MSDETSESEEIAELRAELVKLILDDLRENQTDPIPLSVDEHALDRLLAVWDARLQPLHDRIDELKLELKAVTLSAEDRKQIQNLQKSVDAMYKKMTGSAPPKLSDKEIEAQLRAEAKDRDREKRRNNGGGNGPGGGIFGRFLQWLGRTDSSTDRRIVMAVVVLAVIVLGVLVLRPYFAETRTNDAWAEPTPLPTTSPTGSGYFPPEGEERSIVDETVTATPSPAPTATIVTPRPTPRVTPRPTPRATVRPTPAPTAAATSAPAPAPTATTAAAGTR